MQLIHGGKTTAEKALSYRSALGFKQNDILNMPKRKQYIDRTLRKDRLGDTLVHILLGNFQELPIQHEIFKKKGEKNYTYRALKKKMEKKMEKKKWTF